MLHIQDLSSQKATKKSASVINHCKLQRHWLRSYFFYWLGRFLDAWLCRPQNRNQEKSQTIAPSKLMKSSDSGFPYMDLPLWTCTSKVVWLAKQRISPQPTASSCVTVSRLLQQYLKTVISVVSCTSGSTNIFCIPFKNLYSSSILQRWGVFSLTPRM